VRLCKNPAKEESLIIMRRASTVFISAFALVAIALMAVVSMSAQEIGGNAEARKVKNPVPANQASIDAGKATYMRACRFCHGEDAKGDGPQAPKDSHPSDLTDAKWDRGSTDGEIFAVIRNGAGPKFVMKPNKTMKDDDIWNIVNYLRSIGPKTATKK
jgi:mono/diheme cytochrome c family protein